MLNLLTLPTTCITCVIWTGILIPIRIVELLSRHVLLSLGEELLLMQSVLLISQRLLLTESLFQLLLLFIGALETGEVLKFLRVVDLELVKALLTLQCDH